MDRTTRASLLARLPDSDLVALSRLVVGEHDEITWLTPPTLGMIMARAEDGARADVFNLGEVLVTECQLQIGANEGWAMLLGNRPQGTFAAAAIDAAASTHAHPALPTLDARLDLLIAELDAIDAAERAALATTRVQFDTQ
ncbi:MAG: phosphonate C-P lyase system protein PhnG [Thermomicrobiales bacterium]